MRKLVAIIIAVIVTIGGISGFAYAQTHEPIEGQKLIGYGPHGKNQLNLTHVTLFHLTNPDCKREITIDKISVIDRDGNEYPVVLPNPTLQPHGVRVVGLQGVLGVAPEDQDVSFYTLEVTWSAPNKSLPLIGHVVGIQRGTLESGNSIFGKHRVPMENMKQR